MYPVKWQKDVFLITLAFAAFYLVMWTLSVECIFIMLFGINCPGCGMSRAVFSLLRGDVLGAFSYHPMVFAMPVVYLYIWQNGKVLKNRLLNNFVLIAIAMGFAINYINSFLT